MKTTVGGMEAIIAFAEKTWNCPVVFYTGTRYDNPRYHKLVNLLLELQEKWGIEVIDLWHDEEMGRVSAEDYKLYMNDGVQDVYKRQPCSCRPRWRWRPAGPAPACW